MKRIFCLVLVFVLIIPVAFAQETEFSVRGGISFSSTKADIIAFEKSEGNEVLVNPTNKEFYSKNCLVCKQISFAGYNNSDVIYYFDDADKLVSIIFIVSFGKSQNGKNEMPKAYDRLNKSLDSKYGSSLKLDDALTLEKSEKAYGTVEWLKALGVMGLYSDFEQRVTYIGDGFAEIQIMAAQFYDLDYLGGKGDYERYAVALSYAFIEESVVQEIIDTSEQAENALNSDL